ncbi:energy transducer TonB [uncultured Tateyamaria sp.]|uniref:energy transducer TonB n=1 Tax=uncultured Tateyamaria sp. TaxID=455651 RepID=UPI0034579220
MGLQAVNTGQVISGIGHAGLIGWVLFGGAFQAEPLPFEATDVSVISSEAFEALLTTGPQPDTATDVALPVAPEVDPDPVATPTPDPVVEAEPPQIAPQPEPETVPDTPEPLVQPVPEIVETAPVPPQPPEIAALVPEIAPRPVPRPSDRVAPEAVAPPEPEAAPDPVEQDAVSADEGTEIPAEEQEATAPEEAATEIVTEAEEPAGAPTTSLRPPSRRPTPPATQTAETPAPSDTTATAVNDALREALSGGEDDIPAGPPLSAGEKDALRVAVSSCWNVGSLSSEALLTTVVVGFDMTREGRPVGPSMRMVSSTGGSASAANQAYEAARRAIIRCTGDGYPLPIEKYGQWREIEITFNPERMRIK